MINGLGESKDYNLYLVFSNVHLIELTDIQPKIFSTQGKHANHFTT
jgi:hypothetical protein